ncbi:MAG: dockerin type I repeat-containing protein, partial [Oscillospiraceae bacterium]|nr:dockerin type I repeat-containing protein [Oscillospiraceae bacterium]
PNLEYVKGCTITEVGTHFFASCPNLKSLSFEGCQQQSLDFIDLDLEELVFKDDVDFDYFYLEKNTHIKELHVPQCRSTKVLEAEKKRTHPFLHDPETDEINDLDAVKALFPDFGATVCDSVCSVEIIADEALEVLYLRYDSMHSGVRITDCPNLREIIIEDTDEVLSDAMEQYSNALIEYDSYLDLSNLPSLESMTCYRPETNMYVRAEDCGDFTMYGSKDNTKLQEVCESKNIPYSFLDGCEAYETGDVDGNGAVNIMDVILINRNLMIGANISPKGLEAADVNQDGKVDAVDSLKLLRYIVRVDKVLGK